MHGWEGENRKRSRHMWSVPTVGSTKKTSTVASYSTASTADSFSKDGRKISVGDCALFKPPKDSPPSIGIIRGLTFNKDSKLQLVVNWLYRPPEVKIGKGILLEAVPNEVFYSFHKDEIPAASLLHPCKVAFLPQGAKLPSGVSSFVCRRVYDIANKCLWWLSDQGYINERQEEVDKLLHKTRIEMHATVQPGGRSPKQINGPTSTSQLKPGSDVPGGTSFGSQVKGKKRERADQISEPVKRERSSRTDDGDSGQFKPDSSLKSELAKITERGGLVDSEGVEKLVRLMHPDRAERKMEVISRSMLAGVIAATDNFDCLSRFVQLRGLTILDEWLQDIHKGKIGGGDKPVEELLFVLLRALDRLPVNLHALQMCNIGKSVNHLRTHKNLEIQKKARTLVDMWKKRVEAEMNIIDGKSGSTQAVSWPPRSRIPEVSQAGSRHPGGSSEGPTKSSVIQLSASKTASVKPVQGESSAKSASSSPRLMKSALSPASSKDGQSRYVVGSASDLPSTTAREEKSSGSSQSHNNSQSYSGKEDVRSSTAGSMNLNKFSGGGSRHRKSNNGFVGSGGSGVQRETCSNRTSSLHRNSAAGKVSQSGLVVEKGLDGLIAEGNTHKLIVKIPNRGRSPAQSASGGSFEGPSIMNSRVSSPVVSEKHDQFDGNTKEKSDAYRANVASDVNTESWQSNDFKDALTGSDEGDGSPAIPDEERSGTGDDSGKLADVSKNGSSSSGNVLKSGFSSMNALIESCVKYSEGNVSVSIGDNGGMNLLASVAAGEMSKSDSGSPPDSPQRNITGAEDSCTGHEVKSRAILSDGLAPDQSQVVDGDDGVIEKQASIAGTSCLRGGPHGLSKHALSNFSGDKKNNSSLSEEAAGGEPSGCFNSSNMDLQQTSVPCLETNEKLDEVKGDNSASGTTEKVVDVEGSKELHEREEVGSSGCVGSTQATKPKETGSLLIDGKVGDGLPSVEVGTLAAESSSLENDCQNQNNVNEGLGSGVPKEQTPPPTVMHSERTERTSEDVPHSESIHVPKVEEANEMGSRSRTSQNELQNNEQKAGEVRVVDNQVKAGSGAAAITNQSNEFVEPKTERKENLEACSDGAVSHKETPGFPFQENKQHVSSKGKLIDTEVYETVECVPAKPKFDLNEGFIVDDGKCGESNDMATPGCSAVFQLVNPPSSLGSSVSSGLPASVTVAAAAKGPFVPLEDLLRSKGELGWKGSAATSAFRPTEPRKVLEMPLGTTTDVSHDSTSGTSGKHGRPPLDIDLNVPDETGLDEIGSTSDLVNNRLLPGSDLMDSASLRGSGGLDLDLNRIDEANDMAYPSSSIGRRMEVPLLPVKSSLFGGFLSSEVRRDFDFDLNNGPAVDEASAEPSSSSFVQYGRKIMQSQPTVSGLRPNNVEIGNFASWFQPGNYLPDRGDQPFPIVAPGGPQKLLGSATGGTLFAPDLYRGSILSSSPAVPFASSPFQYPVFPFGNNFPLPSATFTDSSSGGRLCFPGANSPLMGPAGAASSQFPRPYTASLQDGGNNVGVESNRKLGRYGLDLNVGPGGPEVEVRDEALPLAPRQLSVAGSQAALAEEQARMYNNMAGGVWKRKEPEGGLDSESFRYRQSPWP